MDARSARGALPEILRADERARPSATPGLLRLDFQGKVLPIAAIGKGEALANENSRHIATVGVANREFAGVTIGEFGIDTTGKIRPTDQLLQSIGRSLAASPLDALRVAAGLLRLERIGAL